ncbi:MAG TPA: hypothetical protein VD837_14420 [Terriglobales bacterium]|nr:hypothetical protein [Terriglobales bacterium]
MSTRRKHIDDIKRTLRQTNEWTHEQILSEGVLRVRQSARESGSTGTERRRSVTISNG